MRIVLDTSVIVAGLLTPYKAPSEIALMAAAGVLELCYDARILAEYQEVLLRPKFGLKKEKVAKFLEQVKFSGHTVAPKPLGYRLPDKDDEPFLEVAIAGEVSCLITGNLRHYPVKTRQKIPVISPTVFLAEFYPKYS